MDIAELERRLKALEAIDVDTLTTDEAIAHMKAYSSLAFTLEAKNPTPRAGDGVATHNVPTGYNINQLNSFRQ